MNVEALARQSYAAYNGDYQHAPPLHRGQMSWVTRERLGLSGISPLSEQSFLDAFGRIGQYLEEPTSLFLAAQTGIAQLLQGREDHLSPEESRMLAAFLCAPDIMECRALQSDPRVVWTHGYTHTDFRLPNPWYLHLPPDNLPHFEWNRGMKRYIQPERISLRERIDELTTNERPVEILDGGPAEGTCLDEIKREFADRVHTVGVDIHNQKILADESVAGPLEVLPADWTERFDVVISNYAFRYTLFPQKAIKEMVRVLKYEREAYLDIASAFQANPQLAIVRELLGYDIPYDSFYQGLGNFEEIKALIEGWSDEKTRYVVSHARPGTEGGAMSVQIAKHKVSEEDHFVRRSSSV